MIQSIKAFVIWRHFLLGERNRRRKMVKSREGQNLQERNFGHGNEGINGGEWR